MARPKGIRCAFSILGRIGGDATCFPTWAGMMLPSFSILGRIGGDATFCVTEYGYAVPIDFQYPRSDRRRCNGLGRIA